MSRKSWVGVKISIDFTFSLSVQFSHFVWRVPTENWFCVLLLFVFLGCAAGSPGAQRRVSITGWRQGDECLPEPQRPGEAESAHAQQALGWKHDSRIAQEQVRTFSSKCYTEENALGVECFFILLLTKHFVKNKKSVINICFCRSPWSDLSDSGLVLTFEQSSVV